MQASIYTAHSQGHGESNQLGEVARESPGGHCCYLQLQSQETLSELHRPGSGLTLLYFLLYFSLLGD